MLVDDWDELSAETLITAIENSYPEGKELEFKREQNPKNKGHKQSTVGEVVSFANASGGDLVIGMVDKEGTASGLWPKKYDDVDSTKLQWVDIIKRNTDPELPQHLVDVKAIEIGDAHEDYVDDHAPSKTGWVLVVRTKRSWRAPHREKLKRHFYERSAGGKTPLDTGAIRRAMLQGDLVVERAREFRDDRLAAIQANDVAVPLAPQPKVVLHVVPSNAFSTEGTLDPSAAAQSLGTNQDVHPVLLDPNRRHMGRDRYTEDGYLHGQQTRSSQNTFATYTLTFRSGVIEALTANSYNNPDQGYPYIASGHVENCLQTALPTYVEFLTQQDGAFPFYCFVSLVGAHGMAVGSIRTSMASPDSLSVVSRDIARPPATLIESPKSDLEPVIHSLIDSIHNVGGSWGKPRVID
jgi:hypothetical protein